MDRMYNRLMNRPGVLNNQQASTGGNGPDYGLRAALLAAMLLWGVVAFLNLMATVWKIWDWIRSPSVINAVGMAPWWVCISVGVVAHVILSLLEIHGWKSHHRAMYPLIAASNLIDLLSTSWAIKLVVYGSLEAGGAGSNLICVMIGQFIALAPEPMFFICLRVYRNLK